MWLTHLRCNRIASPIQSLIAFPLPISPMRWIAYRQSHFLFPTLNPPSDHPLILDCDWLGSHLKFLPPFPKWNKFFLCKMWKNDFKGFHKYVKPLCSPADAIDCTSPIAIDSSHRHFTPLPLPISIVIIPWVPPKVLHSFHLKIIFSFVKHEIHFLFVLQRPFFPSHKIHHNVLSQCANAMSRMSLIASCISSTMCYTRSHSDLQLWFASVPPKPFCLFNEKFFFVKA